MASPLRKIIDWFNAQDVAEEDIEDVEPVTPPSHTTDTPMKRQKGPLVLRTDREGGMEIRHPRTLDDRMEIGTDLKLRRTVALDLTKMSDTDARYFLEFIYGVVFALDATAEKVNDGIYLLAPRGVPVHNDTDANEPAPHNAPPMRMRTGNGREGQEELFWQGK